MVCPLLEAVDSGTPCESLAKTSLADIYIACVSSAHSVCPKGYYIAIVSTIAETSANHHLELQPGLERLGKIEEQFMVSSSHSRMDQQIGLVSFLQRLLHLTLYGI